MVSLRSLFQVGLVVLPEQPWLCCSPDGLVRLDNEIVLIEIKCSFKYKDTPFIDYAERRTKLQYLIFVNDEITLRRTHPYYTQIQVQLYILNLQRALLFVYSPKQSVIVSVKRDEVFLWNLISKMEYFYFKYFL